MGLLGEDRILKFFWAVNLAKSFNTTEYSFLVTTRPHNNS